MIQGSFKVQSLGPKKFKLLFQKGFSIPKKFKVWIQDYWVKDLRDLRCFSKPAPRTSVGVGALGTFCGVKVYGSGFRCVVVPASFHGPIRENGRDGLQNTIVSQ